MALEDEFVPEPLTEFEPLAVLIEGGVAQKE